MKTSEWTAECTLVQFVFVLCYLNPLVWCLLWIVLLHFIKLQCEMCSSRSTSTMLYVHCLNIHESIGNCTTAAATKAQKRKSGKKSWILCVSLFSFSVCLVLLHSLFWSRFFFVSFFSFIFLLLSLNSVLFFLVIFFFVENTPVFHLHDLDNPYSYIIESKPILHLFYPFFLLLLFKDTKNYYCFVRSLWLFVLTYITVWINRCYFFF